MSTIIQGKILSRDFSPKIFRAKLYQVDDDAPQAAVLWNTLQLEITFERNATGSYTAIFNKELDLIQSTIGFATNIGDDSAGLVAIQNYSGSEIQFKTFVLYNNQLPQLRDNMLCGTLIEIIEYL